MVYTETEIAGMAGLLDRISEPGAKQAFLYFITAFAGQPALSSVPGEHGFMKDLRVLRNGRNCFAFTANSSWLLCYFRRPGLSDGVFSADGIRNRFPSVEETNSGEFKLRVSDYATAKRVASYVLESLAA